MQSAGQFFRLILVLGAAAFCGCSLVDEDLSDCGVDREMDYTLTLVTNMTAELEAQLNLESDAPVFNGLRSYLERVFTDRAHDLDLSFYDVKEDYPRLHHEQHVMDASQSRYVLFLPVHDYMHVAVANLERTPQIGLSGEEYSPTASLVEAGRDTVESHQSGIFTARLPMDVKLGVDQVFDVRLYMANCASALVLDTLGSGVKDVRVFASGFATGFHLADSTYAYGQSPIVRSQKVALEGQDNPLCFATVSFPSPEPPETKVVIETEEPFQSPAAEAALWDIRVYCRLADGSITETILGLKHPLRPGQLKVLRARALPDGSADVEKGAEVTVSVQLNWQEGMGWVIPM